MTVYLVGAGPGDPGLLTRRGAELLGRADLVVHDRLVDQAVLALAVHAQLVDAGKQRGGRVLGQDEINALLIEAGAGSRTVVRLKGGDPYVFGRGGEEAQALEAAGVAYEVVPGVSSVAAVPAAAGVPLTMRGIASSFTVVTGHDLDALDGRIPLAALVAAETLVVMMGGSTGATLAERLIGAGRAASTPVLVVEAGTTPRQRSRRTTLAELGSIEVKSPATLVIGEVATLHFASMEDRPLFGWRVLVTRDGDQAAGLSARLAALGAVPVELATIAITDPPDGGLALAAAAARAGEYDWVVFSSANAVERFFAKLPDARALSGARVAAMGAATARTLGERGIVADLVPTRYVAEGLIEVFPPGPGRVLIPRALAGRDVLGDGLASLGWEVDVVAAYQTVHPQATAAQLAAAASCHAVTFASSSAVSGFLEIAGREAMPPVVVSIGPVTSATAVAAGIEVTLEADEHTASGMLDALVEYATRTPAPERPGRDGAFS